MGGGSAVRTRLAKATTCVLCVTAVAVYAAAGDDLRYTSQGVSVAAALSDLAAAHPDLDYVLAGDSAPGDVSVSGPDLSGLVSALINAYGCDGARYKGIWVVEGSDRTVPAGEAFFTSVGLALEPAGTAVAAFSCDEHYTLPEITAWQVQAELLRRCPPLRSTLGGHVPGPHMSACRVRPAAACGAHLHYRRAARSVPALGDRR